MIDAAGGSAATEWRKGWTVVLAAAMGIAISSVSNYSIGVFIAPLEAEFGWTRAQIAGGFTIASTIAIISSPFVGALVDRWGPRRIGVFGVALYCACFASLSLAGPSIWSWWALWLLMAVAALGVKPVIWTASVSSMFAKGRGIALSVALCGTAFVSTFTPIVGNYAIETYGWRIAFLLLGAFWTLLALPPIALFLTSAKDEQRLGNKAGARPGAASAIAAIEGMTAREALRSWKFIRLAAAGFLAALTVASLVSNFVPILSAGGIARQTAANIAGLTGLATIVGRLTAGFLIDRLNGNLVGGVSVSMAAISCFLLAAYPGSESVAVAAVLLAGLGLGAELDAVAYLTARHFGLRSYGVLFGTVSGMLALAGAMGPLLVNLCFDVTGGYGPILWLWGPLSLLSALLFATLGRYPNGFALTVQDGQPQ